MKKYFVASLALRFVSAKSPFRDLSESYRNICLLIQHLHRKLKGKSGPKLGRDIMHG